MLKACIRCSSIFVGLFSLVQALLWAAGSIWGIAIYECSTSFPFQDKPTDNSHGSGLTYLFYVTYLRGSCANSEFDYVAPTAEKSYKIMMAYSILSSIWVPTSVMLIAGTCLGARGVKATWIYIPWLLVTIACCILDILATILYSIDINSSMTSQGFINMLSFPNDMVRWTLGFKSTVGLDGLSVVPAIIMTLIASRVVILWVFNLFFIIFGLQGICAFSKKKPPKVPRPFHEYQEDQMCQNQEQCREFKKPEQDKAVYKTVQNASPDNRFEEGRSNFGYVHDEPLRLSPVEVEVKQERNNHIRYAEVEDIELEETPQEIRRSQPEEIRFAEIDDADPSETNFESRLKRLERLGLVVPVTHPKDGLKPKFTEPQNIDQINGSIAGSEYTDPVSEGESALEAEDFAVVISKTPPPVPEDNPAETEPPRRVYDVNGNPTEETLTPQVTRIKRIIEAHIKSRQMSDLNGFNAKPFSYHQPLQPQVDTVPKKNDTIRGLEKPPIPVPDYSVRVGKKASFRTPLPNTE